jgi:hypothetical protein
MLLRIDYARYVQVLPACLAFSLRLFAARRCIAR